MDYIVNEWKIHVGEEASRSCLSDCVGGELTRGEVEKISNKVNGWLRKKGIGREDMVLINLERGVKPVVAVMGIWKAGAAFTIVESTYAADITAFIYKDSSAKLKLDEDAWKEILDTEPVEESAVPDPHDLCLMVYTSGTTGTPKGVIHEYGQLALEMLSERRSDGSFRETSKSRWGLVAPLNFVASIKFIIHFYYSGGHLYVLDYDTIKHPKKLSAYFLKNRIEGVFMSPSLMRIKKDGYGPFLKYIYTGAEPANNLYIRGPELGNTYTMSESLFTVCKFIIDKAYPIVPIGNPTFDLKIKMIGPDGKESDEQGELCFENTYCRGYVNNPEENERHFIDGYFHTGDLAEYKDGMYILKGRSDDMIKINGNRIEPSEIEAVCIEEMKISNCVAKGFEEEGFVALYYTQDLDFDEKELRKSLEKRLPYYMVPTYFVHIEHFPLTNSGKLNRRALERPVELMKEEYVAPRNDFDKKLSETFTQVLGVKNIGIKDDFFKLGGNSLKVMEMLSILDEDDLMTPTLIYQGRTIECISDLYNEASAAYLTSEQKEEEGRKGRYPLSRTLQTYWTGLNDCSIDFYSGYKISPLIPSSVLEKRINKYIAKNSSFNLVLDEGENGIPVQVYTDKTPFVKIEKVSGKDAQNIIDNFVHPFGFNEPLIRIRVLKAPDATYFLFHAFHLIIDGAGMHYLLEDLLKCMSGKDEDVQNVYYFSWAYDENRRDHSHLNDENSKYFQKTYPMSIYDYCIHEDMNTGKSGHANAGPCKVPLDHVKNYAEKKGVSIQMFLIASILLAQSAYNGTNANLLRWNYINRGPKDNRTGLMERGALCKIHRDEIKSVDDLFEKIALQNETQLWRLYEHDHYFEVRDGAKPRMCITYLEDWFSKSSMPGIMGKRLPLKNNATVNPEAEKVFLCRCTHEDGNLCVNMGYGLSWLTEEHAEKFINMVEFSMNELLNDRLPNFNETLIK